MIDRLASNRSGGVRRALAWTALLRLLMRGMAVVTTLALARILDPEQYGVFATIAIAHQFLAAATDLGLDAAVVQDARDPRPSIPTAWSANIARGAILSAVVWFAAPWYCHTFGVPDGTPLLQTLAAAPLLVSLHSMGPALLRRELRYGPIAALHASEALTYGVVAVSLAFATRSAWALVAAVLASFAVRVLVSHVISPVRPRIGFDRKMFANMFRFSRWTTAFGLVDVLLETFDNAVVARLVGPTGLGYYRMGYQLATEGSQGAQWVVTSVAFPAVARAQFDQAHVRRSFRAILGGTAAALFPLTLLLVALAPTIAPLLLGERWAPIADPLRVLAIAAGARAVIDTARPVLLGLGRSAADFSLKLAQTGLMVTLVIPAGIAAGAQGVSYGVLVAALATVPVWAILLRRNAPLKTRDLFEPLIAPALATGIGVIGLASTPTGTSWTALVMQIGAFGIAYAAATFVFLRVLPASGLAAARRTAPA